MTRARDLEEDLLLPLEHDFAIVDPARHSTSADRSRSDAEASSPSYLVRGRQPVQRQSLARPWWLPSMTSGVKLRTPRTAQTCSIVNPRRQSHRTGALIRGRSRSQPVCRSRSAGYTGSGMIRTFRPIPLKKIKLVLFDLDGTLIDSELDLAASVNAMLRHFGRKELPLEVIDTYIGDGAPMLIRRALGDPAHASHCAGGAELLSALLSRAQTRHHRPYDGIPAGACSRSRPATDAPGRWQY